MPEYDKRKQELTDRLTALQGFLRVDETLRIQDALSRYFARRSDGLSNLAYLLSDLSMEPKASDFGGMLKLVAKDTTDILHTMLDSVREPSAEALKFRGEALAEDARFWEGLQTLYLGELRDLLLKQEQRLIDYTKNLRDKWSKLTDEEKAMEQLDQEGSRAINALFRETLERGLPVHLRALKAFDDLIGGIKQMKRDISSFIAQQLIQAGAEKDVAVAIGFFSTYGIFKKAQAPLVEQLGGPAGKELLSALSDAYDDPLRNWIQGRCAEHVIALKQRMTNRNSLLMTFSSTRHDADAFLRDNSFNTAKDMWRNAESSLKSWAGGISSSGLKGDAESWVEDVLEGFSQRLDKLEDVYNTFISENERRFVGSLGPELEEAFLHTRAWEDWESTLFSYDVESKLRAWRSSLPEYRAKVEGAFDELAGAFGDLPSGLQERFKEELNLVRADYLGKLSSAEERASRTLEQAEAASSESALRPRLDRRILQETLRR